MRQAAVMLIVCNGFILSVSRRNNPAKFGLPGGKVEENETPQAAAIRETFEETGVKVNSCDLIFIRMEPKDSPEGEDFNTHCFYATSWEGTPSNSEEGIVKFLSYEELISSEMGAFPEYNELTFDKFNELYPDVFVH